jgi:hypothetical protein
LRCVCPHPEAAIAYRKAHNAAIWFFTDHVEIRLRGSERVSGVTLIEATANAKAQEDAARARQALAHATY